MKPVTVIQGTGNGALLVCARIGSLIVRQCMNARITHPEEARAEAQAMYPNREIKLYLPGVKS